MCMGCRYLGCLGTCSRKIQQFWLLLGAPLVPSLFVSWMSFRPQVRGDIPGCPSAQRRRALFRASHRPCLVPSPGDGAEGRGDLVSFVPVVPSALRQGSSRGTKIPFPSLRGHPWAQTRGPDSGPSEIIPMECHCGGHSPGPRSGGGCGQWPGPTLASCLWGEGGSQFACPPGVVFGVPAIWVSRITGSWCPELEVIWWSPPTFLGWSLNPQWDGIWKWGLCEVMGFR